MLKSWSLLRKLVLANVLYAIPVIALIVLMVSAQNVNIDFAVQEEKGDQLQRPLQGLFADLSDLRANTKVEASQLEKVQKVTRGP